MEKIKKEIMESLFHINEDTIIQEYIEPFWSGSSVVIYLLLDCFMEIDKMGINDKDLGIASLWIALLKHPEELQILIKKFKPSVNHFYKALQKENCDDLSQVLFHRQMDFCIKEK